MVGKAAESIGRILRAGDRDQGQPVAVEWMAEREQVNAERRNVHA